MDLKLFWEYTASWRFWWIDDGTFYRSKASTHMYANRRWAIVNCTPYGETNQHSKQGYNLWHKGKVIKHSLKVKELKLIVEAEEKKLGNKIVFY